MDSHIVNIKVVLNGSSFYLKVPADQEPHYRMAAEYMNSLIKDYGKKFRVNYIDLLTMVAFDLAVQLKQQSATPEQEKQFGDILKALSSNE